VEIQVHGALVDVDEVGVLIVGPSGIGKSECALELVRRGHRLVSDDLVRIRPGKESGSLVGTAPELIRHYMEIRGIGLLHIPDLYGADSVKMEAGVDLLVKLEDWKEGAEYERVGLERATEDIAGVPVSALLLPLRPAGSMATLIEVAARDARRRRAGSNAARRLDDELRASDRAKVATSE
jgi:HPr kinase/phosphorylase